MQGLRAMVILRGMNDNSNEAASALVIATYSREMGLWTATGLTVRGRVKGRKIKPVCGDRVLATPLDNEPEWLITEICQRCNQLTRPNMRGQTEVLAANIEFLCVVAAASPTPDWFIVDRYLAAAELIGVPAMVIYNKTDLGDIDDKSAAALADYAAIGYETVRCSALTGVNLDQLQSALADRTSIIVGQSGVGKSSLINSLVDTAGLRTGEVSGSTGEGRHTTVNSQMLELDGGGAVIDSPGVRDYAPAIESLDLVAAGFREITARAQNCRFANCQHAEEPNCAVKTAVDDEEISQRRYDSYRRLKVLSEQLARKRK